MSEEREESLSSDERLAILSQVFKKPNTINEKQEVGVGAGSTPPSSHSGKEPGDSKVTSPSEESFGSLLEKTLQKRNAMDKEESATINEDRKHAIDESRKDLIGSMIKVFFR